jgi:uncharacterized protein (TIGR00255 family)
MTGYGKSSATFTAKTISVEIRSLNSKSMDIYLKSPSVYRDKELPIRKIVADHLIRGKVDVSINIENQGLTKNVEINKELATAYFQDLKATNEFLGVISEINYLELVLKMPDIFIQTNEEITKEEIDFLFTLVSEACVNLNEFRKQEGDSLHTELVSRIEEIRLLLKEVEQYESVRIETVKERIKTNLNDIENASIDENRLHQELIYYIEKLDVTEEKVRLANHLDYFLETMKTEASGRKLGFITQEIGREINTLGSKSNHAEMQKIVVNMKDNLEKIKEQVLNTL